MPELEQQKPEQPPANHAPSPARWLLPLAALAVMIGIGLLIQGKLRNEIWSYFTDDQGTRVKVQDGRERYILWQDPRQSLFQEEGSTEEPDPVNQASGRLEAAFSPNGTSMVLVRTEAENTRADLYWSTWDGRLWTRPTALSALNTEADERGPAFSRDGRYLYFSSDREGGQGGTDIYVARWNGQEWTGVGALGTTVNSPAHETGPAPTTDGNRLYFSSNRDGTGNDIFVSQRLEETPSDPGETANEAAPEPVEPKNPANSGEAVVELPPLPKFRNGEIVDHLNSSAEDLQAALTRRGNHVFLASDRDRNTESGFGVYFSRVIDGDALPPERVDLYLDKGDVTDPAVRMEGFDLLFSTNSGTSEEEEGFKLYRSTTREVIGYTNLDRWESFKELMKNIGWWILLALLALIALLYLMEAWQDITNLFHKCLAGSAVVHLIILFLLMLWLIAREVGGKEPQSPVATVSIEALMEEELALESEPEQAQIAETKNLVMTEKFDSDFKIPVFKPRENTKVVPIVTKTSSASLVPSVRPSKLNESESEQEQPQPTKELTVLTSLPETFLPEPEDPTLEEEQVTDQQLAEKPADPAETEFKPTESLEQVEPKQAEEHEVVDTAIENEAESKDVSQTDSAPQAADTGGDIVNPHRGLEALGAPPELDGAGDAITNLLNLPGDAQANDPLLPGKLATPTNDLDTRAITKLIKKQRGRPSLDTIEQLGGSDATERAIGAALEWLARNQEGDGRWDMRKHGANGAYDTAGAGLALLCFYGWGEVHNKGGKYQATVQRALDWLIKQQKENGDLRGGGRMYCHGIAAIALCEAYGATKDPKLREPAEKAIALILASQSPSKGGWRYNPVNQNSQPSEDSDLSVTAWQYMALHSARLADLSVPDAAFTQAQNYLSSVSSGKHGGLYAYTGGGPNPAMTASGMFCRQLDLVPPTDPRMPESAEYLGRHKLQQNPKYYYMYYATLALYQHQGPVWKEWNEKLKEVLPLIQKKVGPERGSWDPGGQHARAGGRVVSTTLSVLSLEVYYRLLPMYGFRGADDLPAAKKKGE